MAINRLEIYDEGQSLGFWKSVGFDTPGYEADKLIRVNSVSDMVIKVLATIGNQRLAVEIFLYGEGDVNFQSVGANASEDSSGDRSLQVDSKGELNKAGKVWLPRLIGRVSGIYLLGVDNRYDKASLPLFFALVKILPGIQIHNHLGDGFHAINYGKSEGRQTILRTDAERQRLRNELSKLNRR